MSEEFSTIALGAVGSITMGQSPGAETYNSEDHGLPFLQGCAEFGALNPLPEIYCDPPLRVAKKDSILISVRAPVGTMNLADQDYCIGRGLGAVQGIAGKANTSFLRYAIAQNVGFLHRRSQGSTFLAISSGELRLLPIPDIGFKTQGRIAEVLSTLDRTIEKTEALITKYQQIKAGLMHDLFTRGVTADGKLRPPREQAPELYHETPIGWIPKDWDVVELSTEIGIGHGFAFSGEFFSDTPPGEVLLTPGNFHRNGGLYFTAENTKYFQGSIPPVTVLPNGEMVTVMTDLSPQTLILGRFAIVETPFLLLHNQRIGRVILKRKDCWDWSYLCYALNNERIRRKIIVEATGTTVRHTSPARILGNQVARPHLEEQRRSIEVIRSLERQSVEEQALLLKSKQQKLGLMHDLLTGCVQVKFAETKVVPA